MGAFLTVCMVPSVGMLFYPERKPAANQILAPPPSLAEEDGRFNTAVLQETSDYLSDHFAFRQELITAHSALMAKMFQVSTEDKVLLGKEGWLFYRETVAGHLRKSPLSEDQLRASARALALMAEYARSRGASLSFTSAPNKATLYPQYLPNLGQPLPGESDLERLIPLLEEKGVDYIDLLDPLRQAAQSESLYFRLDSHWNAQGAALAQERLLTALGKEFISFRQSASRPVQTHRGDLYEMLYPAGTSLDWDFQFERPFAFSYVRQPRGPEDQRIETTRPEKSGSLLMFRDSFGNHLYPLMAEEYSSALFSRSMPYQMTLLDQCGADTVVIELVERNLSYLATQAPVLPAPERQLTGGSPPMGRGSVRLSTSDASPLEGYTRLEGVLTGEVDCGSPIYVQLGGRLYEASPVGKNWQDGHPFVLYIPQDGPQRGEVLYLQGGQLHALIPQPENPFRHPSSLQSTLLANK